MSATAAPSDYDQSIREDMGYFSPTPRRTAQMSIRVPPSVKEALDDLARAWTILERIENGEDPRDKKAAEVTVADVVNRLLKIGVEGSWTELQVERPLSEEDWEAFIDNALADRKAK